MLGMLALTACASSPSSSPTVAGGHDIHRNSVMITNLAANHGGTGIVLRSTQSASLILTNAHVCKVVEQGGLVRGEAGSFMVTAYKPSLKNDLCLIKVEGNLKANTAVSKRAPKAYYDQTAVSGHPALMPNIISRGHFSGRQVLQVVIGIKKCTEEDAQNPEKALACMLIGGIPIIKSYDSALVSATIMPGSSGSGVYNSDNELAGVVFAGSGQLGYGWTVPYQSVIDFLTRESKSLQYSLPNNELDLFGDKKERTEEVMFEKLHKVCESSEQGKLGQICAIVKTDALWYK
jgi:hypothetical protein